jgi:protein involved in sex pheromone biosynthesis
MIREFKNQKFFIKDGKVIIKTRKIKIKKLNRIRKEKKLKNNFITADIETRNIKGVLIPVCFCIYDGKIKKSFYLDNYSSANDMLLAALGYILTTKNHGKNIYFHNFSFFDGIFVLNKLVSGKDINVKPTLKDGQMINIRVELINNFNKKNIMLILGILFFFLKIL